MRGIVHIGLAKTGSTLIQRFLKANRPALGARGYALRYATRELLDYGLGTGPEPSYEGEHHTLIYSDERLSFGLDREEVARVLALLARYCDDIKVIAYVRRQDEVFVSAYSTALMSGETRRLFEIEPMPLQRPFKQIRHWEVVLGRGRTAVRRYGPGYLPKGLLADFCKVAGIEGKGLEFPDRANVSPAADVLELMRLLNIRFAGHPERRKILKSLAEFEGTGQAIGLGRRQRERINAQAQEEDERLAVRYLKLDALFDHPLLDNAQRAVALQPDAIVRLIQSGGAQRSFTAPPPPGTGLDSVLDWVASTIVRVD